MDSVTIIDEGHETQVEGVVRGGRVLLPAASLEPALGFVSKPEGLCKGDVCIPVQPDSGLEVDGAFDVTRLAEILGRPAAVDESDRVAYFGPRVAERAGQLQSLTAPDFTLPDLDGNLHTLSDYRGRKVILAAYASW